MSEIQYQFGYLLKHAYTRLTELAEGALASHEINGRDLAILRVIEEDGPLSQQDVVRELSVDRTTMVALIDNLEDRGLVGRRPHPNDRRKHAVELTPHGQAVLAAAKPVALAAEHRFLEPLSESDVKQLRQVLRALVIVSD